MQSTGPHPQVTIDLGGIIRGKAMGNALNMANMPPTEDFDEELPSQIGKVQLFVSSNNPEFLDLVNMQPTMTAEALQSPILGYL